MNKDILCVFVQFDTCILKLHIFKKNCEGFLTSFGQLDVNGKVTFSKMAKVLTVVYEKFNVEF